MVAKNQQFLGKRGVINLDGLEVKVQVVDVKSAYGNERFQITTGIKNDNGTWQAIWVSADRVKLNQPKATE